MIITSAQYMADITFNEVTCIKATVNDEVLYVPIDPDNRHYAAILEWAKEDGNEIQAAD